MNKIKEFFKLRFLLLKYFYSDQLMFLNIIGKIIIIISFLPFVFIISFVLSKKYIEWFIKD